MRDQIGVDLDARGDREELGGVGIGETVIRIYCMKKIISLKERKTRGWEQTFLARSIPGIRGHLFSNSTS